MFCYQCLTLLEWHFSPLVRYFHCMDGMTLWLCFGSYELGLVLPLVCVSHPSPATCWIWHSLSLRYGNGLLSGVIRLVHILLPVPYTHRGARVRYIHALRRLTTIVDSGLALTVTWWGTEGVQVASLNLRPLHLPFSSKSRAGLRFREGEEHPVPHGQCFMPVRVPSGIGGWCIIVLPSLSYFCI